jgi:hypothetical protein
MYDIGNSQANHLLHSGPQRCGPFFIGNKKSRPYGQLAKLDGITPS